MPAAGDLRERVAFSRRAEVNPDAPDDYGNTQSIWVEQFRTRALFRYRGGSEVVLAARLAGVQTVEVWVRASPLTREIAPDWLMTDQTSGTELNVRTATHHPDRAWITLICQSGVAA